jgi:hypothetical protein
MGRSAERLNGRPFGRPILGLLQIRTQVADDRSKVHQREIEAGENEQYNGDPLDDHVMVRRGRE